MIRTATIQFPRTLVIKGALELDDLLEGQPPAARFVFDFSALGRTEPFGMLCAAVKMARFISAHPDSEISAVNHSHCSYQSHMGFFRALGFDFGKEPGAAQGSANYLPITSLSVEEIQNEAAETYVHVGDVVTSHAQRISEVLSQSDRGPVFETLSFSIREIIRNVVEHSASENVFFCAQHWPTRHEVQVAILDTGIGVRAALQRNPYLRINSDLDALKLCVMPGVSGRAFKGSRQPGYDQWQNSGYGLYMSCRLAAQGGDFSIFSGDAGFAVLPDGEHRDITFPLTGTAVRLVLNTGRISELKSSLSRFAAEGRDMAQRFGGNAPSGASVASVTIRTRFR